MPSDDAPAASRRGRALALLVVPPLLVWLASRTGVVAYRVMRAVGEEARQGPAQWWMAGGPEPAARVVQQLVSAAVLVALVLVVARLIRHPAGMGLGLCRGRVSPGVWGMLAIGSFAAFLAAALLVGLLTRLLGIPEESGVISHYFNLVAGAPAAVAVVMIAAVALGAGISEELLVRGWLQSRLLRQWRPGVAIALAALDFGIMHGHPASMLYAFPLGLWLGYIAWRAGSIVPAMLCHAAIDAAPLTAVRMGVDLDFETTPAHEWWITGLILAVCAAMAVVGVRKLERAARGAAGTAIATS